MFKFQPFPIFNTTHLRLIELTHQHIHDLFNMRSDTRMHEYTDTIPDETLMETQNYIEKMLKGITDNKWIIWAIEHKETKKIIGTISIWNFQNNIAELGYGIIPSYQGKGLMKEALLAVINYGLTNLELSGLDAYTEVSNLRSIELLRSCRFDYIKEVVDKGCVKHRDYSMVCYRIKANEMEYKNA